MAQKRKYHFESPDEPVVFEMPDGTKISNDPRWLADQNQMVSDAAARAARLATETSNRSTPGTVDNPGDGSDVTGPSQSPDDLQLQADSPVTLPDNFEEMKGQELKDLKTSLEAQGVEVDTTGVKKVGELREAISKAVQNHNEA